MRAQTQLLEAEAERLKRAEAESVKNQKSAESAPKSSQDAARLEVEREVEAAFVTLMLRHDDFAQYTDKISRVSELLKPSDARRIAMVDYLEALYVVAKHANFMKEPIAVPAQPKVQGSEKP
ncbi:hypothetical protein [Paludibaculum fermentans]|uniref:hypothetical protein n=1 Tax=Paludibaculum fermentans TaxID=1473598 RepID=UPI003EBF1970